MTQNKYMCGTLARTELDLSRRSPVNRQRSFLNYRIADLLVYAVLLIGPICSVIDVYLFKNATVMGLSACNFLLSAAIVIACLLNSASPGNRCDAFILSFSSLLFCFLLKIIFQPVEEISRWLSMHEYYYLVPLFAFSLSCFDRDKLLDCVKKLLNISVGVCLISLVFFLKNDYFGLVSEQVILTYDVVGMPFSRMMGTFGSPNVAGSYFAIMLFLDCKSVDSTNVFTLTRKCLLGLCLILTFSRMAILGFIAAIVIIYLQKNSVQTNKIMNISIVRILAALTTLLLILFVFSVLAKRGIYFLNFFNDDALHNIRFSKWLAFLRYGPESLLLGESIGSTLTYGGYSLSDNSFLFSIASFGFSFSIIYWISMAYGVKNLAGTSLKLAPMLMLIIFLFLSDFIQLFPSSYMVFLLFLDRQSFRCLN